jgi:hypothetical protein
MIHSHVAPVSYSPSGPATADDGYAAINGKEVTNQVNGEMRAILFATIVVVQTLQETLWIYFRLNFFGLCPHCIKRYNK